MNYFKNLVKTFPKKLAILLVLSGLITLMQFRFLPRKSTLPVTTFYLAQLNKFRGQLDKLNSLVDIKAPVSSLRTEFKNTRLTFKKLAIITDYYNIYETRLLNGPDLEWIQDDDPTVLTPHGLQVVEAQLFETGDGLNYADVKEEIGGMIVVCNGLLAERNLDFKFTDELVMEALQLSLIRTMTLGITGFDSPIALHSIPETTSTLEGFLELFQLYKSSLSKKSISEFNKVRERISAAILFLKVNTDFNKFDRLRFITEFISPAYSSFTKGGMQSGLLKKEDRRPVNATAKSFFAPEAFNINAFSPQSRYRITNERIALGKKLFYDPILSHAANRSCASCHNPELAFTDGNKTALAVDGKTSLARNTPTLLNSVFQTKQFFDSRTSVLENQLSDVVHNQEEMKGSLKESVDELSRNPDYVAMFDKAYPDDNQKIHPYTIANAISSYIRSLVALNSRFDRYMRGNKNTLTASEKKGFNLFMGKAKCATCHFMPLFNGLVPPSFMETESEVLGVPSTNDTLHPVLDKDPGKISFTSARIHRFAFKTPTLRNIALTAPYMHNGVFKSLEEVMDFYNKGGGWGLGIAPPNQTLPSVKLNLTKREINDIISFMKSLTDTVIRPLPLAR